MSTSVTKASAVEVKRLQSTASFLFAADSARLQLPFLVEGGKHLAEEFKAAEVGVRPGERATWVVQPLGRHRARESLAERLHKWSLPRCKLARTLGFVIVD